jgi:hypothetical protein
MPQLALPQKAWSEYKAAPGCRERAPEPRIVDNRPNVSDALPLPHRVYRTQPRCGR